MFMTYKLQKDLQVIVTYLIKKLLNGQELCMIQIIAILTLKGT